jgi:hypothetical protein
MRKTLTLAVAAFAISRTALPAEVYPMREYLEGQISTLTEAMEKGEDVQPDENGAVNDQWWYFRRMFLRIRPRVVLSAHIAKIGIVPDIELYFEHRDPEGYIPYQPK